MTLLKALGLRPAFGFAGFVCWLATFPMAGSLLDGRADLLWFLVPHTLLLFFVAGLRRPVLLQRLTSGGIAATALLTLLFPWVQAAEPLLLLLGVTAAPLSLRAGVTLKSAPNPLLAALFGLVAGNFGVALLSALPPGLSGYFLAALALLPLLATRLPARVAEGEAKGLFFYLPFLFVFQLVSGLMYGFLYPAYGEHALLPGSELLFYIGGVAVAVVLFRKSRDLTLAAGVILAMVAFTLLVQEGSGYLFNGSMFAMMAAAGVVDLFLLGYVLSFTNTVRAYGIGTGVLCGGIVAGRLVSMAAGDAGTDAGLAGSMLLNIAVLTLFFISRRRQRQVARPRKAPDAVGAPASTQSVVPVPLAARLSEQERAVLEGVVAGGTYKDVSHCLGISESSVKTYMRRVFQKSGTRTKRELLAHLACADHGHR